MPEERTFLPDWASPPGATIEDLLSLNRLTLDDFADRLGFSVDEAHDLIRGERGIDYGIARSLQDILGSSAEFWVRREERYRTSIARWRFDRPGLSEDEWLKLMPIADMVRFGWLAVGRAKHQRLAACFDFFGVTSVAQWQNSNRAMLNVAAFRSTSAFKTNPAAVSAWLRWGDIKAASIQCGRWNPAGFRSALSEIRRLTWQRDPSRFLPRLVAKCAENGVAVVVARAPQACRASGATRFVSPQKAVIQLSFRYLSNDQFWFTFFHEAGHLLLHGMEALFLEDDSDVDAEAEKEADLFATEILIPSNQAEQLGDLHMTPKAIMKFARAVGIAPGIVVGQLQHRGYLGQDRLNGLKRRYRWDEINSALSSQ